MAQASATTEPRPTRPPRSPRPARSSTTTRSPPTGSAGKAIRRGSEAQALMQRTIDAQAVQAGSVDVPDAAGRRADTPALGDRQSSPTQASDIRCGPRSGSGRSPRSRRNSPEYTGGDLPVAGRCRNGPSQRVISSRPAPARASAQRQTDLGEDRADVVETQADSRTSARTDGYRRGQSSSFRGGCAGAIGLARCVEQQIGLGTGDSWPSGRPGSQPSL